MMSHCIWPVSKGNAFPVMYTLACNFIVIYLLWNARKSGHCMYIATSSWDTEQNHESWTPVQYSSKFLFNNFQDISLGARQLILVMKKTQQKKEPPQAPPDKVATINGRCHRTLGTQCNQLWRSYITASIRQEDYTAQDCFHPDIHLCTLSVYNTAVDTLACYSSVNLLSGMYGSMGSVSSASIDYESGISHDLCNVERPSYSKADLNSSESVFALHIIKQFTYTI